MLNKCYIQITVTFYLFFSCLLASVDVNADESSLNRDFITFVERVETLQNTNITDALVFLDSYSMSINALTVENQVKYYQVLSELHMETSQYQLGLSATAQGLQLAKYLTVPSILIAELSYLRGFGFESLGDKDRAVKNYLNGLEIAESLEEMKYIAEGLINLGAIYYLSEEYEQSLIMLNDALTIANTLDNEELKGSVNSELGILYAYMYQPKKAIKFYQASYYHFKKAGRELYALYSLQNIAANHMEENRYEQAIPLLEELIENGDKFSNNEVLAEVHIRMAMAHVMKKEPNSEAAYQYLIIAEQYVKDVEQHNVPMYFTVKKAYILEAMGRYEEALDSLRLAEELLAKNSKTKNTYSHYNLMYLQSEIYYKTGKYQQAYEKQSQFLTRLLNDENSVNMEKVEELRLSYESKQADLQKKILEQELSVQVMQLNDVTYHEKNLQFLIFFVGLVLLTLAWFLLKITQGQKHLAKVSQMDELTGVVNRRHLIALGEKMFSQAQQENNCLSVLMLDVDNFKAINDTFGHKVGDDVLRDIARLSLDTMRITDCFGRFGGEEFICLLPDTSQKQAYDIAERLRLIIENHQWHNKTLEKVTASIGVASFQKEHTDSFLTLLKDADITMYQAKSQGRNRVCS
ncbi:MAG: diguanylate cyclase [Colwellia sp.]|nr:diguanylate cyclase [Colwellia sp.]